MVAAHSPSPQAGPRLVKDLLHDWSADQQHVHFLGAWECRISASPQTSQIRIWGVIYLHQPSACSLATDGWSWVPDPTTFLRMTLGRFLSSPIFRMGVIIACLHCIVEEVNKKMYIKCLAWCLRNIVSVNEIIINIIIIVTIIISESYPREHYSPNYTYPGIKHDLFGQE